MKVTQKQLNLTKQQVKQTPTVNVWSELTKSRHSISLSDIDHVETIEISSLPIRYFQPNGLRPQIARGPSGPSPEQAHLPCSYTPPITGVRWPQRLQQQALAPGYQCILSPAFQLDDGGYAQDTELHITTYSKTKVQNIIMTSDVDTGCMMDV